MSYRCFGRARSLRSERAVDPYVATERAVDRYLATELWLELLELGCYVATERALGRYVATERNGRSVAM
ncbi:hypothetical protein F2Q69_00006356 [Brassica cretica]|uniref:Uncharacterized protein n=1 Tax=Brassica cretica TaxID=69181 RepID=A0A8S9NPT7_BRACR|nr:hypothetical protein F2Q69_00006356 [Brassica cretica]